MHSIFAELFVHPWWVDALIIGGMLAAIYLLLIGLKRIWHCIKKGKKTQTANDYNEKLFKTATENTDNSIQMKFTENAILTARESLHSPEMIMGDKLEVLTENESEINDDEIIRVGSIHHTKSKSSTINSKKEVQFKENSDNKDNNDDGFDENKDNGSHGDYIEYQNDDKNKNNNNNDNENENIENIENKKKGSKHYKNDPSLTGIMHGIGGIMSNLRDSGDLNNMSIGISELEFSDDESDDDQLHKQDLRKSLKLAGASSFILRQLKTLSVRHIFGDGDEDTPAAPGIAEGTDGIEGVPGVGSEAAMNSKGKDVVVGPSIDEGDNEDDNEDENDNVDDNQSDKSF